MSTPAQMLPTLPNYVPPGPTSAGVLNGMAQPKRLTVAADNKVVPVVYGRDRLYGSVMLVHVDETNGFFYASYGICEGPIQAFEAIYVDGVEISATNGLLSKAGVVVNTYTGTSGQSADAALAAAISGYADTNADVAYVVLKIPLSVLSGFPRLEAIVQGKKLYDPRLDDTNGGSGAHRLNNSATWTYSVCPALALADFVTRYTDWTVRWPSVIETANANDVSVGGVARREIGLALTHVSSVGNWLAVLRTYAACFTVWEQGEIRLIPDRKDVDAPMQLQFTSGSSQYVDFGTASRTFTDGQAQRSFECWFEVGAVGARQAILDAAKFYLEFGSDDKVMFGIRGSDAAFHEAKDPTARVVGEKIHVCGVYKASDYVKLFVNGVEVASTSHATTIDDVYLSPKNMFVGRSERTPGFYLTGKVDDVRVWSAARTGADILADYLTELEGDESNLLCYWRFNDGVGQTAVDSTASPMNGTLVGTPIWVTGVDALLPYGVVRHFAAADIVDGSLRLKKRAIGQAPTVVEVEYTDSSGVSEWPTYIQDAVSPGVTAGTESRRVSRVSLPGIHRASQAKREAVERLNWMLSDLTASVQVFDEGLELQPGSIVQVTHPIGLSYKMFRVLRLGGERGYWNLELVEYDPAIYSDAVISNPTFPDTNLGNPLNIPAPTNLSTVEEVYREKSGNYSSRLRMTWTKPVTPYLSGYKVEGYIGATLIFQMTSALETAVSPAVDQLVGGAPVTITVKVYTTTGFTESVATQQNVVVYGKLAVPGNVPSVNATQLAADEFEVNWTAATDVDIWRYDVRKGATTDTWATATLVERTDGLRAIVRGLAIGTHRIFVKAIDSVLNESAEATYVDVTVSYPAQVTEFSGFEVGGEVRLSWAETPGFIAGYKISYGTTAPGPESVLDVADSLRFVTRDIVEGPWRFYVRAVDTAGRESQTASSIDLTVTSDINAFIVTEFEFVNPSLTNMSLYQLRLDSTKYYVTDMNTAFKATYPSDFKDHENDPLANYHASGSGEWLSETKDFGSQLQATWLATVDFTVLGGSVTKVLELSTDNVAWDTFASLSARGTYRYARIRITTTTTSTVLVMAPDQHVSLSVVAMEETGTSTALTSGPKTITLSKTYAAVKDINVVPTGTGALIPMVDNVIVGSPTSFDVYVFDKFGQKIAAPFTWKFRGV